MIIKNAYVYTENHEFHKKDIVIQNERIVENVCSEMQQEIIDATGLYAIHSLSRSRRT